MPRRLEITVSDEVWARLDDARGHEPRASFVKRALEGMLDGLLSPRVIVPSEAEVLAGGFTPYDGPEPEPYVVTDAKQAALERQARLNAARYKK